jgi:tRNA threonylcarbamoyladenosine biosynthesis protein TsaE
VPLILPDADATEAAGRRLGAVLQRGDLLILTGELGAGKTTFTRGIGVGLGVRGPITSPTFVIARIHPPLGSGPELLHVDAYRLDSAEQLWDLDLDTDVAVTIVEWGRGKAEGLADDWVEITLDRATGESMPPDGTAEDHSDARSVSWHCRGPRWAKVDLGALLSGRSDTSAS